MKVQRHLASLWVWLWHLVWGFGCRFRAEPVAGWSYTIWASSRDIFLWVSQKLFSFS